MRTSAAIGWAWWVVITSLPQAPVSEEPEAREAESWGRALALKLPVIDNYHNRNNQKTTEGKREISMEYDLRKLEAYDWEINTIPPWIHVYLWLELRK